MAVTAHDLGPLNDVCEHCGAIHWPAEKPQASRGYTACCKAGDISLPGFTEPPAFLKDLLLGDAPQARAFRKDIRKYNYAFAFISVNCETTDRGATGNGPTCFQIKGTLYHLTGPLIPASGAVPRNTQLYFYDPHIADNYRLHSMQGLNADILTQISIFLEDHNPFIPLYKSARERLQAAISSNNPVKAFAMGQDWS